MPPVGARRRRKPGTGTVQQRGRQKWVLIMPERLGGKQRTGFETRAEAERLLDEAVVAGVVPPSRKRLRDLAGKTPTVLLSADDFAWARNTISFIARKHRHFCDDLESEAMLALHLASLDYRGGKNPFRSYAWLKIRGAVIDFLRAQNRTVRNAKMGKEPERKRAALYVVLDELAWSRLPAPADDPPEDRIDEQRRQQELERLIAQLPERTAAMLRMRLVDETSLSEIGKAFGVTESRACQIVNGALEAIAGAKVLLRKA